MDERCEMRDVRCEMMGLPEGACRTVGKTTRVYIHMHKFHAQLNCDGVGVGVGAGVCADMCVMGRGRSCVPYCNDWVRKSAQRSPAGYTEKQTTLGAKRAGQRQLNRQADRRRWACKILKCRH